MRQIKTKTFKEWIMEENPEMSETNWRNAAGALALAVPSFFGMQNHAAATEPTRNITIRHNHDARQEAMQRVAKTHKLADNWKNEQRMIQPKMIEKILSLDTEREHDDLIRQITKDMEDQVKQYMVGRHHPDKEIQKNEISHVQRSFEYQVKDFFRTLVYVSKMNL